MIMCEQLIKSSKFLSGRIWRQQSKSTMLGKGESKPSKYIIGNISTVTSSFTKRVMIC